MRYVGLQGINILTLLDSFFLIILISLEARGSLLAHVLLYALQAQANHAGVRALINYFINIQYIRQKTYSFLCAATYGDSITINDTFQEKVVDINAASKSTDYNTALHCAVLRGNLDLVKDLISNGANINVKNIEGDTPLHIAIKEKKYPIIHFLLIRGADLSIKNYDQLSLVDAVKLFFKDNQQFKNPLI